MKKVSRRAMFALVLAVVLLLGSAVFLAQYFVKAADWVTFPGSPHVYSGGTLDAAVLTDRDGTLLMDSRNGREFAADAQTRAAFLHLLGDREGYIYAPMLPAFADRMIGFDPVQGLFGRADGQAQVKLSLSADVQTAALQAMNGRRGVVGVYNYKTGELLCAVTSPSYDPDNRPDVENDTTGQYNGVYVNRFFNLTYTPGSIFKLVTAAAAIEKIEDIDSRTFTCTGKTIIGGQEVICSGNHGTLTFSEALAHSCNVAFGELAAELGADTLQSYAKKLGLCESLDFDGYHCAEGVCDLSDADRGDTAWAGIGQYTVEVNALTFLRFMGMIAGGSEAADPFMMASVTVGDQAVYQAERKDADCTLQPETCQKVQQMMRYAVQNIYGDWQFGGLSVCAKSGTAEHEGRAADAMFAGFVQDEAYPLAFVVFVEEGGSGSAVAAPLAAKVLAACVQELS